MGNPAAMEQATRTQEGKVHDGDRMRRRSSVASVSLMHTIMEVAGTEPQKGDASIPTFMEGAGICSGKCNASTIHLQESSPVSLVQPRQTRDDSPAAVEDAMLMRGGGAGEADRRRRSSSSWSISSLVQSRQQDRVHPFVLEGEV